MINKEQLDEILRYKQDLVAGNIDEVYKNINLSPYWFTKALIDIGYTPEQILNKMKEIIKSQQFDGLWNKETLIIPESIVGIEGLAFNNNKDLKTVKLSSNLRFISDGAFKDCSNLESINLEDTKTKIISGHTFTNCASLKSIKLPATIEQVFNFAFKDCINLKDVYIDLPDQEAARTMVFIFAFDGCPATIHFRNGITYKV